MIDLDALCAESQKVKLGGKEYEIPRGFSSIPLRAVPLGSELAPIFTRLQKDSQALTDDDVGLIIRFLSLATSVPVDALQDLPLAVIHALFAALSGEEQK